MTEQVVINVFETVGSELCVASDDGQKIYEQIERVLHDGRKAALSFLHVESLTSAFLNVAIGQLYGRFSEEEIKESLSVQNMEPEDLALLKRVVDTAKQYFDDPSRFKEIKREVMEESDEA